MSMMHSPVFLIALMAFLIVVVSGCYLAVRIYGARAVKDDHP